MAEWAVAGAETGRVSDRRLHVADAALDGLRQRQSLAEACGDGGRQRTAGAVRVLSVHTHGVEQTHLVSVEEQVDDRLALGLTARTLDELDWALGYDPAYVGVAQTGPKPT